MLEPGGIRGAKALRQQERRSYIHTDSLLPFRSMVISLNGFTISDACVVH